MLLDHGESESLMSERCFFCNTTVLGGNEPLLHHISRHLEEISAAALPRSATSNTRDDTECEASETNSSLQLDLEDSDDPDNIFASQTLGDTDIEHNAQRNMEKDSVSPSARSAMNETTARDQIRKALQKAGNAQPPIASLSEFTDLVREFYLDPMVYEKHTSIIVEMWNEYRNKSPPSPQANATIRSDPDSEASVVPRDDPNRLPVLDPKVRKAHMEDSIKVSDLVTADRGRSLVHDVTNTGTRPRLVQTM